MKIVLRLFLFLSLVALPLCGHAAIWGAGDSEHWDLALTPYLFTPNLNADAKIDGAEHHFDHPSSPDFVNYGFRMRVEAWKGKFGILSNFRYMHMWDETELSNDTVQLNGNYTSLDAAASWRFLQTEFNNSAHSDLGMEVFAGVRTAFMRSEFDFSAQPDSSRNKNWLEPLIGSRVIFGLNERISFVAKGDVGGFGLGSGSSLVWDFNPEVLFLLTDGVYINAGYEIFDLKTENESGASENEFHGRMAGPTLGVTFQFSTGG